MICNRYRMRNFSANKARLGDIGFRTNAGERVQAECVSVRQNFMNEDECARYEVYRSSFGPVLEGTTFNRPEMF